MKKRVVISEEIQNLINVSKAAPAVLTHRLITDMLLRKYGDKAVALLEQRKVLIASLHREVDDHPMVGYVKSIGGVVKVDTGSKSRICSDTVTDHFRALDHNSPRSPHTGMKRAAQSGIYQHSVAEAYFYQGCVSYSNGSSDISKAVADLFGEKVSTTWLGWKTEEYEPSWNHSRSGAYFVVPLKALLPDISAAFEKLLEAEVKMVKAMHSDACLLLSQTSKARSIKTLINKIPDILEHKDLKTMLGFSDNPQKARVKALTEAFSGSTMR